MIKRFFIRAAMGADVPWLCQEIMRINGWTQSQLAEAVGIDQSQIPRWIRGAKPERENYDKLISVAQKLGILSHRKFASGATSIIAYVREVDISGYVGAGATVLKVTHDTLNNRLDELETVEIPAGFGEVAAYKVRGDSMIPAYEDGDVICVSEYNGPIDDLIGRECIVLTRDDQWLLKKIERGSQAHRYTLISHNASPIRDVQIVQASPVRFIRKRGA